MGMRESPAREETKHLIFEEIKWTGKTYIIDVRNKLNGISIGEIRWHGAWRKYVYYPNNDTLYDSGCLSEISKFLKALMEAKKHDTRIKSA